MAETQEAPPIENKVAQSGLITLNLDDYRPKGPRKAIDVKDALFQGLILKEKDFRTWARDHDWSQYQGAYVALYCSADAIVPAWAYMLIATLIEPYAADFRFADPDELENMLLLDALKQVDWAAYTDERIILKGCGTTPTVAYVEASRLLRPHVKTLMYGEPCSTVPIYKKKKAPAKK